MTGPAGVTGAVNRPHEAICNLVKQNALARSQRLKSSSDFARIYAGRVRAADANLLVYAAVNTLEKTRFGMSVSRKVGSAVERNSVKRRMREAFRLSQHELPQGLDLILIPQRGTAGSAGLADYRESLVELAHRLARRIGVGQT
jgi:ribonuclease P protein component